MNTLAFQIKPSPSSNDHQVRIIIDGDDWLGDDSLGIDPPEFFAQRALFQGGELLIGRCDCGCLGCGDITVQVDRKEAENLWIIREGLFYSFAAGDYDRLVETSLNDFSWEDDKRTSERLVSDLLIGSETDTGFEFDWASARIKEGIITLSFSRDVQQKTFEFEWDGKNPKSALPGVERFRAKRNKPD